MGIIMLALDCERLLMQSLGGCILTFLESLVFIQFDLVRDCVKESVFIRALLKM